MMLASDCFSSYQAGFRARVRSLAHPVGILALIVCTVLLDACGSPDAKTAQPAAGSILPTAAITVVIKNSGYQPANFTVPPGATVTVRNDDPGIHTLTADNGAFNTGNINRGLPATFTAPTTPGRYPYHCLFHDYMTGVLTVSS
jgi:plastocyanin